MNYMYNGKIHPTKLKSKSIAQPNPAAPEKHLNMTP